MRFDVLKAVAYETSRICSLVVWYIVINASKKSVAPIFSPEDGSIRFLQNFDNDVPDYVESHPRRLSMRYTLRTVVKKTELRGLSPQANYTDRATAACRRC
jgi:hypothetical protein